MWQHAGLIRDADGLAAARERLAHLLLWPPAGQTPYTLETANLTLAGRLLVGAALARRESRGAHYRTDYPETSPAWRCHINLVLSNEQ